MFHRRDALHAGITLGTYQALRLLLGEAPAPARGRPRGLVSEQSGPLLVPPGFVVQVLSKAGNMMSDGLKVPAYPDGMACFSLPNGDWSLMRNHEVGPDSAPVDPEQNREHAYRPGCFGGVTRLVLDPKTLAVRSENLVLTGTLLNCAGGPSPWGWLTCEETEDPDHGYVFVCNPSAERAEPPRIVRAYGRFRHEAVAVDPRTMTAYLTEDQKDGSLYRMRPPDVTAPFDGELEALCLAGRPRVDTRELKPGKLYPVEWVRVPDAEARRDRVRAQAWTLGAARVHRGEGIWLDLGDRLRETSVVFTATTGGAAGLGQIFRLHVGKPQARDMLEVIASAPAEGGMQHPDNITISPWGQPVFAEDGLPPQQLRMVRPNGDTIPLAENTISPSEFAGVCFSPDGSTLFCNLQKDGLTVAIRGPWQSFLGSS